MFKNKNTDFKITVLTVLIPVIMQFIFIRYMSYSVDKVDYGNFVLLQTLIAGLSAILLQIPGQAFDRFFNKAKDKVSFVNEFRTILILINFISFFIILLYGFIMDKFSNEILFIALIYFILLNNYVMNQKVFLLNLDRKKYFYLKLFEAFSKFIAPILSYIYFQSLESLLLGIIVGYILSYGLLVSFLKKYPYKLMINMQNIKKYFLYSYPILFVSIFTWGISFSDRYFIDYYLSTKDVAIYALLAMVAGVGQIIGQVYFLLTEPKIYKKYEEDAVGTFQEIKGYLIKLVLIFIVIGITAIFIPREIYTILLEKNIIFDEYYFSTFIILLIAIFANILHIAHHMYLKLIERLDILAYILGIAFLINLIGNTFIDKYGIIMAAISTLVSYLSILFMQIIFMKRFNTMENTENVKKNI